MKEGKILFKILTYGEKIIVMTLIYKKFVKFSTDVFLL